ncbi:hypothetical protein JW796_04190 [Candidatus Dojkabacteria bacterium]|nr:hypothetical protein [Candidatus Dojkabacteria bacterium]
MLALIIILSLLIILMAPFPVVGFFIGAPYYPSNSRKVKKMIELADLRKGQTVADLGAGDGRVIYEASKKGVEAHCIEINPILTLYSRLKFRKIKNIKIINKNMWKVDLSSYDRIFLFCLSKEMKKFEKKLQMEMKPGSLVISNIFKFNKWIPVKAQDSIYVYKVTK